jgi:uncharacterized membrane protein YbhN (UPF0104 family)
MEKEKVKLFQNVAGHTSSKRVIALCLFTIGSILSIYLILYSIHYKTAIEFTDLAYAVFLLFIAPASALLGVSLFEYFSKLNPLKK